MKRCSAFYLLSVLFFVHSPLAIAADEELKALVKQLAAQVNQLSNRVVDLEQQLATEKAAKLEQSRQSGLASTTPTTTPGVTANKAPTSTPASEKAVAPSVTAGDFNGSIKIPGTDSSLGIGGFIKLDAMYNSVSAGKNELGDQSLVPSSIPVGRTQHLGEHGQFNMHAKESRIWFKTHTPNKEWGDFNTYLEMDFYGAAGTYTYTPRIRHAYGSLGHLLAGQTWTTFTNATALPELLDVNGPIGKDIVRQPMIRWSQPFTVYGIPLEWQAAIEEPRSMLITPTKTGLARDYQDDDRYPDVVFKLGYDPTWGSLSLAGMARQIRVSSNSAQNERSVIGGGVSFAGKFRTYDLDNIRFMLSYGDAIGRYASTGAFDDAVVLSSPEKPNRLLPIPVTSGYVAYQHWWNQNLRSTLAYGFAKADNQLSLADLNRQSQSVHLNLLWSPLLQTTFGVEYIYAQREREDHASGSLHRVQLSTRFNF